MGRVAVCASSYFNIHAAQGLVQSVSHRNYTLIQRVDGYGYWLTTIALEKGAAGMGSWRSPRT